MKTELKAQVFADRKQVFANLFSSIMSHVSENSKFDLMDFEFFKTLFLVNNLNNGWIIQMLSSGRFTRNNR